MIVHDVHQLFHGDILTDGNISTINQKTILKRIIRTGTVNDQVRKIKSERERMTSLLAAIPAVIKVYPSDANFLLVKVTNARSAYEYLAGRKVIKVIFIAI